MTLEIIEWQRSPLKGKKYRVILSDNTHRDFGSSLHDQYQDKTPLRLFAERDHLDKKRRENYYKRHKKNYGRLTPDYLSKKFLW